MGRTTFKWAPRLFTVWPLHEAPNAGLGATSQTAQLFPPFLDKDMPSTGLLVGTNRQRVAFNHGIVYSVGDVTGTIDINVDNGASRAPITKLNSVIPVSADHSSGYIKAGVDGVEAQVLAGSLRGVNRSSNNQPTRLLGECAAGEQCDGLFGLFVGSPGQLVSSALADVDPPLTGSTGRTWMAGGAVGGLNTIPFPAALTAPTGQTNLTLRRIRLPMGFRLLGAITSAQASAAGNSLRLINQDTGDIVIPAQSITAATPSAVVFNADTGTFGAGGRAFDKGVDLELQATTGGTGAITGGCMTLVGFFTSGPDVVGEMYRQFYDAIVNNRAADRDRAVPSTHFAGPVAGGLDSWYWNKVAATGTGTNKVVHTFTAPFDFEPVLANFQAGTSAAGNTVRLYNSTQGVSITGSVAAVDTGLAAYQATLSPTTNIDRGDVIQLQVTAAATQFTNLTASLEGIVKGFPYDNPVFD